jgi:hypothetical protein
MSADFEYFSKVIETGTKMKKVMQKKKLKFAKAACPHCKNGMLHGMLAGRKEHLHMYCDNSDCGVRFIE